MCSETTLRYLADGVHPGQFFMDEHVPSDDDARRAWDILRDELIDECIREHGPGRRPTAFWKFDCIDRREAEHEAETLTRLALLRDDERLAVDALLDSPAAFYRGRVTNSKDLKLIDGIEAAAEAVQDGATLRSAWHLARCGTSNCVTEPGKLYASAESQRLAAIIVQRKAWYGVDHLDAGVRFAAWGSYDYPVPRSVLTDSQWAAVRADDDARFKAALQRTARRDGGR